jgi:type I restriction enzyme, S subunit
MAGKWKSVALEDVAEELTVGYVGPMASEYVDEGIPFLRSLNVDPLRINKNDLKFITPEFHNRIRKSRLTPGDVVIVRTGKPGACSVVPEWLADANCSDLVIVRCGPQINNQFLAYYVNTVASAHVAAHLVGAVQQHFNVGSARTLRINLPPLPIQQRIAQILGTLDDKIELNRRMNATLEATTRALFQSWFTDFDPVRQNMDRKTGGRNQPSPAAARHPLPPGEGRGEGAAGMLAGLEAATANLFPAHLEDSPLGHIPKGWKEGTVVEGFNLTMGQSPPGDTYNEEGNGIPFYQGRTDFGFRFPTRRIYCSSPTRYAKPGDTLVSVRAPVGDINMANEECCIGRGVAAVRHKSGATSFTYHSMANLYPDFARFEAEGTVFGSINKDSFEKLRFVIPPKEIISAYERLAGPLDEQICCFEKQSRTLATLRDTLLPKLLGGEMSVAETP